MQPAPLSNEVPEIGSSIENTGLWDLAELCLQQTSQALQKARCGTPAEISQAMSLAREAHALKNPADLIETLARVLGHGEEHLAPVILDLGNKVALTLPTYAPFIPFAGKLIAPSAFYDTFSHVHESARILLSPVIFAEDTDAVGTASINPVASMLLAEEIRNVATKRFGIRPFVTVARLDYESWTFLCRKHFEL